MTQNDKPVIVYSTWPDVASAESAGAALVEAGLAACANILPGMTSIYVWKGQRQRDAEAVMLLKTRAGLTERIVATIAARHPYETPAILVLAVEAGAQPFVDWILAATSSPA